MNKGPAKRSPYCRREAARSRPYELLAGTDDLDFHATVLCTTFASGVRGDGVGFALAFGVDTVGRDALADEVVLHGSGAALGQTQVVLLGTDRVGVADGDQGFEVQCFNLSGHLIEDLTAFGLERGLVEVEERVGIQDNLGGGGSHDLRLGNGHAVAAGDTGGGCPESVAPAEFVSAVHPDVAERVLPVVDSLCGDCTGSGSGRESECQCDFGGFIHVSPRLS